MTIGRTREVRGPDGFERGAVGIIIAVVAAIAVWAGVQLVHMVQTLDAVSLASGAETDEVVYYSMHGRWPLAANPNIIPPSSHSKYVEHLSLDQAGAITAEMNLGPVQEIMTRNGGRVTDPAIHGFLSFRPELLGAADAPAISFLCGYAQPSPGAAVSSGTNRTTLSRQDLPPFCR